MKRHLKVMTRDWIREVSGEQDVSWVRRDDLWYSESGGLAKDADQKLFEKLFRKESKCPCGTTNIVNCKWCTDRLKRRRGIDWNLITSLYEVLSYYEKHHKWDLSSGEMTELVKSFYGSLSKGKSDLFQDDEVLKAVFHKAFLATWGDGLGSHAPSKTELQWFKRIVLEVRT